MKPGLLVGCMFKRRFGRSAVASVEMGIVAPLLIAFCAGISDCSLVFHNKLALASALASAAEYAFNKGQSETGSTLTSDVTAFLNAESEITLSAASVTYYGGATSTSYYCVSTTGVFTGSYTQGEACSDGSGSTAGQFVAISGSFAFKAVFPTDKVFMPTSFSQTVIVRLA
jgi:Flp pilus assembly protein TadG